MINELHRAIAVFMHVMMASTFAFAVALGVSGATNASPKHCVSCMSTAAGKPAVAQPSAPKTALLKIRNS